MADPLPYAPRPINKEIYKAYGAFIDRKRAVHITQHDMVLDMLCVLPDYQGKGIGTRFLKWGMDKADANNARIYLEATLEGYPLYLKYGWKVVEEFVLDYEKYGGAGSQKFVLMMREPQTGENM
ncbi:hypothetical protein EYZ11_005720 [Aspergillus tanneri]|nr:hypothetical protein EYZ11_005720 [Aspergillus tanneri]